MVRTLCPNQFTNIELNTGFLRHIFCVQKVINLLMYNGYGCNVDLQFQYSKTGMHVFYVNLDLYSKKNKL